MRDSSAATLLLLLLLSPLAICIIQAASTRLFRRLCLSIAPQLLSLGIVLLGNVPMIWLSWEFGLRIFTRDLSNLVCGAALVVLTYNALGFCYFCLVNLSETSLHVHILMELMLSGTIAMDELLARYGVTEMIDARVDRMIALGQLRSQNGAFVVTSRSLLMVGRIIHFWRKLLRLPLSPV